MCYNSTMDVGLLLKTWEDDYELSPEQTLMLHMLRRSVVDLGLVNRKNKPVRHCLMFYPNIVNACEWWFSPNDFITPQDCLSAMPHGDDYVDMIIEYVREWVVNTWTYTEMEACLL